MIDDFYFFHSGSQVLDEELPQVVQRLQLFGLENEGENGITGSQRGAERRQPLQLNSPPSPPVPSGPAWPALFCPASRCKTTSNMSKCCCGNRKQRAVPARDLRELVQLAALLLVGGFELLVFHPEPLLLQHDLLVQTGRGATQRWSQAQDIQQEGSAFIPALLLQVGDQLLLVVQLVSQAADLLLVSFAVGVDLLLHRFLDAQKRGILT